MYQILAPSEDQIAIREAVAKTCAQFDDEYWLKTDETGEWPEKFTKASNFLIPDGGKSFRSNIASS